VYVAFLDRLISRHPFEGRSAVQYARDERPAFGDLDDRLLDSLAADLGAAEAGAHRRLLDVGCGPATFTRRAGERLRALSVIAIDPSRDFARPGVVRATSEALPIADRAIDVAICLSSIRHVRDRAASLRELRRVVRGVLVIVELDPAADRRRIANHTERLASPILRRAFGPLFVRTAPPEAMIRELARAAGFALRARRDDPVQPVYVLELV
jgi:ubiquinone/menaquinone biosynthesis C-methylase UbiE